MAYIFQEGMLEPVQVQESVQDCMDGLNSAASRDWHFSLFTDFAGDPVVLQVPSITRISANP
jgi:hypothetical protein